MIPTYFETRTSVLNDVTSIHPRPKAEFRKNPDLFVAVLKHSYTTLLGGLSHTWIVWDIRYSDHFGKNFSTSLKILNMQQLRNFLGRKSPLKASHIYIYKLFRSKVYCWAITPNPPPTQHPSFPNTQPSLSSFPYQPPNWTSWTSVSSFEALLGINANTEAIQSACLARKVFRVVLGVKVCRGRTLLGTDNLRLEMCSTYSNYKYI